MPRPSPDVVRLFAARALRMFAYGLFSIVLVLHLSAAGLDGPAVGLLLTLTLLGDTAVSFVLTTRADRWGRRRTLLLGAALSQELPAGARTGVFAWYQLAGSLATAAGALAGGALAEGLQRRGLAPLTSYQAVMAAYGLAGLLLAAIFAGLSARVEAPGRAAPAGARAPWLGLHRSRGVVARLSGLFAVDAFAGGFVVQSFVAWWFHVRFGLGPAALGGIFLGANVLAGLSALSAAWLARRFGLVNTMVFTHLPSNVLLAAVPFMPTLPLAIGVLLVRFSISQMDVPTRQAFTMAVVAPDERSSAAGVTGIARTVGAALSPLAAGPLYAVPALAFLPFVLSGALKVGYDVALWRSFRAHGAEEDAEAP
ncbi:MAG: MFS transporter [Anaeromyxobacteraceae bacterium]